MCFSIPKQIKSIKHNRATTADGLEISLGNLKKMEEGDYVRVFGNMAVERLTKTDASAILNTIKLLNKS